MRNGQDNWCLLTDKHSVIDKSEGLTAILHPCLGSADKVFSALLSAFGISHSKFQLMSRTVLASGNLY